METGIAALLVGAGFYLAIENAPPGCLRAAGGALLILTVLAIAWQCAVLLLHLPRP